MVRRYVLQYVFPRGEGGTPDRGVIDKAVTDMARPLEALERCYQSRDFVGGAAPSYADFLLTPILDYLGRFPEGGHLLSDRPNIRRALDTMRARPSFAAATAPHDATPAAQAR
jgi:glutathione S-transferase